MHSQKQYIKFARILMEEYKRERPFELDLKSYKYENVIFALEKLGCEVKADKTEPWRVTVIAPVKPSHKKTAVAAQTTYMA